MTPEEWKRGRDLVTKLRSIQALRLSLIGVVPDWEDALHAESEALAAARWWLADNADELLAAARPKCERCNGRTTYFQPCSGCGPPRVLYHRCESGQIECPDCNGTGWAC